MKIISVFWHSVKPDSINPEIFVFPHPPVSLFRENIIFIVNNYTPISIYEFIKIGQNAKLKRHYKKPPILLGFDDGFKNVITHALPILEEFNVPALFFVCGEILKNPDFIPWDSEIVYLLRRTRKRTIYFCKKRFDLDSLLKIGLLRNFVCSFFRACKSEEERQKLLNDFATTLGIDRPVNSLDMDDDYHLVSKEELSSLESTCLLTIASHAMTHRTLTTMTYEEQKYELEMSDLLFRENVQSYYPTIAYPQSLFNMDSVRIAKQIYKSAFGGLLGVAYNNIYAYPRLCIGYRTVEELKYVLSSLYRNIIFPVKRVLHSIGVRKI